MTQPGQKPVPINKEDSDVSLATITVSSRLPDFWKETPRLWFVHFESVLANQKLSDEVKYNLLVAKLSKEIIQQASDILLSPPDIKKYDTLKNRLLACYEESENRQFQKLLSEMELGEQKPSQLLRKMRDLARDKLPVETLLMMWTGHLPPSIRAVLAVSDNRDPDSLAAIADKIIETTRPIEISEVTSSKPACNSGPDLAAELSKLRLEVMQLKRRQGRQVWRDMRRGNRSRSTSRRRRRESTSGPRRTPGEEDWLCFYHFRYKQRATKCVQPCAWKQEKTEN